MTETAIPVAPVRGKTPTDAVLVGCKLPNGLVIHRGKWQTDSWFEVKLAGANSSRLLGGYGQTRVDRAFMTQWMKDNAKTPAVVQGLIFFADKADDVESYFSNGGLRTGLEPLDPTKSLPKGVAQLTVKD